MSPEDYAKYLYQNDLDRYRIPGRPLDPDDPWNWRADGTWIEDPALELPPPRYNPFTDQAIAQSEAARDAILQGQRSGISPSATRNDPWSPNPQLYYQQSRGVAPMAAAPQEQTLPSLDELERQRRAQMLAIAQSIAAMDTQLQGARSGISPIAAHTAAMARSSLGAGRMGPPSQNLVGQMGLGSMPAEQAALAQAGGTMPSMGEVGGSLNPLWGQRPAEMAYQVPNLREATSEKWQGNERAQHDRSLAIRQKKGSLVPAGKAGKNEERYGGDQSGTPMSWDKMIALNQAAIRGEGPNIALTGTPLTQDERDAFAKAARNRSRNMLADTRQAKTEARAQLTQRAQMKDAVRQMRRGNQIPAFRQMMAAVGPAFGGGAEGGEVNPAAMWIMWMMFGREAPKMLEGMAQVTGAQAAAGRNKTLAQGEAREQKKQDFALSPQGMEVAAKRGDATRRAFRDQVNSGKLTPAADEAWGYLSPGEATTLDASLVPYLSGPKYVQQAADIVADLYRKKILIPGNERLYAAAIADKIAPEFWDAIQSAPPTDTAAAIIRDILAGRPPSLAAMKKTGKVARTAQQEAEVQARGEKNLRSAEERAKALRGNRSWAFPPSSDVNFGPGL